MNTRIAALALAGSLASALAAFANRMLWDHGEAAALANTGDMN